MRVSFSNERAQAMLRRYRELGTLQAVGDEYGVTRERVRQILNKAARMGLFTAWKRPKPPPLGEEEAWELLAAGQYMNVSLARMLGLTPELCIEFRHEDKRAQAAAEYAALVERYGYHPNDTDLQFRLNQRPLSVRINRYFGGFPAFCELYGYTPKRMRGLSNPKWRQYARERRSEQMRVCNENGICVLCTRFPQVSGKKMCAACYERTVTHLTRVRREYQANRQ